MEHNLYDYVFHYNPYRKLWMAIPTAGYASYFADSRNDAGVLESKDINTLVELICKGNDYIKLLNLI